jgi:hypothetical protein
MNLNKENQAQSKRARQYWLIKWLIFILNSSCIPSATKSGYLRNLRVGFKLPILQCKRRTTSETDGRSRRIDWSKRIDYWPILRSPKPADHRSWTAVNSGRWWVTAHTSHDEIESSHVRVIRMVRCDHTERSAESDWVCLDMLKASGYILSEVKVGCRIVHFRSWTSKRNRWVEVRVGFGVELTRKASPWRVWSLWIVPSAVES